ncbi:DedA family protein [Candidatus Woesearchaeota archaeon]|nr:DedA family protein [Candidatus Woesearchaeota archaeon]
MAWGMIDITGAATLISESSQGWLYLVLFLLAIIESTPLFGIFVPGQFLVAAAGFLSRDGTLHLGVVIAVSAIGAILGDIIGYWLGRKHGKQFISRYGKYVFLKEEHFLAAKEFLTNHPGKALVIGRFHSITRAITPFTAGATRLRYRTFLSFNIIGGITWAACFSMVGFVFGKSYDTASQYVGTFFIILIVIGIAVLYLFRKTLNKKLSAAAMKAKESARKRVERIKARRMERLRACEKSGSEK